MEYTELKIRLMQQGAIFTPEARAKMCRNRFGNITVSDYATTGGIVVNINNVFYANVPVKFVDTPFCIDNNGEQFVLKQKDSILPVSVTIWPVPQYALSNIRLENGTPIRELVMIHADRMRISPIHGCAYHCQFCTCNSQKYRENPLEILEQGVEMVLQDPNNQPRHILLSGGTPQTEESSYRYLNQVYHFFPNKYKEFEFDVMLSPRGLYGGCDDVDTYAEFLQYLSDECRIKTISVNLELYNEILRKEYIPDKWKIGKENYLFFIKKAVDIFGAGNVRSSLVVGLEEKEDTLRGVEQLLDCGCIPVLSTFVPANGTFMQRYEKPEVEFLLEVVHEAASLAHQNQMILGPTCRPCTHNSITEEPGDIEMEQL